MFGHTWYHGLLRGYSAVFGNLFNDIRVQRRNKDGTVIQELEVPIAYGPRQVWLSRIQQDIDHDQDIAIQLPMLSFELTGLRRMADRQPISIRKNAAINNQGTSTLHQQYIHIPYELTYQLNFMTKNSDEMFQVVEQITPFFTPDWSVKVSAIPDMNYSDDIIIKLESINLDDTYEGSLEERRVITGTFEFTMEARFYGPKRTTGIIKRSQVDLLVPRGGQTHAIDAEDIGSTPRQSRIVVKPGLNANGDPTSDPNETIDISQIDATDDWGFIEDVFFFQDGKKFNPITGNDEDV